MNSDNKVSCLDLFKKLNILPLVPIHISLTYVCC